MDIAQRSIKSSFYNTVANIFQVFILFFRSVILTRILSPEIFGGFVLATSIVDITQALPNFGLNEALIFRPSKIDQEKALQTHFSFNLIFSIVWALLFFIGVSLIAPVEDRWIYWFLIIFAFLSRLTHTPRALLVKNIEFRRLAAINIINALVTTVVAILLALSGYGFWALLAPRIFSAIVNWVGFYGIKPVWKPKIGWNKPIGLELLKFGKTIFVSNTILRLLDQLDDIWTGLVLGDSALGLYNRAYKFANYPRRIISAPINSVAIGTYSQLQESRKRLSQAFFRINGFLVRLNFLFAGILTLVAPEFIRIVIGAQWLPMLDAFRLMMIYTLLDPIKLTIANVINASGAPGKVSRARIIQLVILVFSLIIFVPRMDISGVAIAVDLMLVVGILILLWELKAYVDFSLRKLFGIPGLALSIGMVLARLAISIPGILGSDWRTASVKIFVYTVIYLGILLTFERQLIPMFRETITTLGVDQFFRKKSAVKD